MKWAITAMALAFLCEGTANAGIRADLSGDVTIDFATTMDMPIMIVGNPGNAADAATAADVVREMVGA